MNLPIARAALEALGAFALPQRCAACGGHGTAERVLCEVCEARIPPLRSGLCVRCLQEDREPVGCRRHRGLEVWPAWIYDERAACVVQALKFGGRTRIAGPLGPVIARALPPGYRPDMVLEVPLHASRRRERGFDQASRLADAVARVLAAPRVPGALHRVRATREQSRLGPAARRDNASGAFALREPGAFRGRRVLLVDDVVTSGSTLAAALAPLREAGAETLAAALAWAA